MELTSEQKQKVAAWLEEGANLSEIQQRLGKEFEIGLTYMETRFLIDDLKLQFKEPEPAPVVEPAVINAEFDAVEPDPDAATAFAGPDGAFPPAAGRVSLKVDTIMRPGSLVSGSVTFSDGKKAAWYLDQSGSLGMVPEEQGYRPPTPDVAEFQAALERELVKLGI